MSQTIRLLNGTECPVIILKHCFVRTDSQTHGGQTTSAASNGTIFPTGLCQKAMRSFYSDC